MARKFMTMVAAGALAVGSTAAQAAAPLSLAHSPEARASASMEGASELRRDQVAVALGVLLIILLIAVFVDDGPDSP
jgi:hypothetical protein